MPDLLQALQRADIVAASKARAALGGGWLQNLTKIWHLAIAGQRTVLMEASWNTKFCGPGAGKRARVRAGSEFYTV
jgi:hypothetical protein